jgi:hypothetical protein
LRFGKKIAEELSFLWVFSLSCFGERVSDRRNAFVAPDFHQGLFLGCFFGLKFDLVAG